MKRKILVFMSLLVFGSSATVHGMNRSEDNNGEIESQQEEFQTDTNSETKIPTGKQLEEANLPYYEPTEQTGVGPSVPELPLLEEGNPLADSMLNPLTRGYGNSFDDPPVRDYSYTTILKNINELNELKASGQYFSPRKTSRSEVYIPLQSSSSWPLGKRIATDDFTVYKWPDNMFERTIIITNVGVVKGKWVDMKLVQYYNVGQIGLGINRDIFKNVREYDSGFLTMTSFNGTVEYLDHNEGTEVKVQEFMTIGGLNQHFYMLGSVTLFDIRNYSGNGNALAEKYFVSDDNYTQHSRDRNQDWLIADYSLTTSRTPPFVTFPYVPTSASTVHLITNPTNKMYINVVNTPIVRTGSVAFTSPYEVKITGDMPLSNQLDEKLEYKIKTSVPPRDSSVKIDTVNQWTVPIPSAFELKELVIKDKTGIDRAADFTTTTNNNELVVKTKPEIIKNTNYYNQEYEFSFYLIAKNGGNLTPYRDGEKIVVSLQGKLNINNNISLDFGPAEAEMPNPNNQELLDLRQSVINASDQSVDNQIVFSGQKLTFYTMIESKIASNTVLYNDIIVEGVIDTSLEDIKNLKLMREDRKTSVGTVFYNSRTRTFQASVSKSDNVLGFENLYLIYEANVKKDVPSGTKITAQSIISGNFTEDNDLGGDVPSNVVSVEVAKLFDLNHSVTGMTGQGGKAEIGDSLKYEVNLISHMKAITPPYLYKDFKFEIEIDKNLEAPTDLMFILPNGQVTPGEITYNPTTRKLTGITRETAGALGQRDIRIRYTAKVAKTAQAGATIRAKTSAGGTYTQISSSTPVVAADQLATVIVGEFVNEGTLDFVSAPNNFKYGNEDIQVSQENQEYKAQEDQALIIKDSRKIGSQWSLTARMTTVLTNGKYTLPESVYYRRNGIDQLIGENISANIFERKTTSDDDIRISDAWNGVETYPLIKVRGNTAHKGEYKGWIQWTLQDVP